MLNRYIKFGIIAGLLAFAVWLFYIWWIFTGIMVILVAGIFVLLLFQHERILQALWFMRKQKMDKAFNAIDKIKNPEQLPKKQEAMVYFLKGSFGAQNRSIGKTESLLKKALSTGLKNDQYKAMAKMNLAAISMQKRRKREALNYLNEAKKLDSQGLLGDQIKYLKSQMGRI